MIRTQGKERSKLEVVGIEEKGYQGALRNHRKTILSLKKKKMCIMVLEAHTTTTR